MPKKNGQTSLRNPAVWSLSIPYDIEPFTLEDYYLSDIVLAISTYM